MLLNKLRSRLRSFVEWTEMCLQRCVRQSIEQHLLIRHLLDTFLLQYSLYQFCFLKLRMNRSISPIADYFPMVFKETTNSTYLVRQSRRKTQCRGLCPPPKRGSSRPLGGQGTTVVQLNSMTRRPCARFGGSPPIPYGTSRATRNGDPWLAPGFPVRCES